MGIRTLMPVDSTPPPSSSTATIDAVRAGMCATGIVSVDSNSVIGMVVPMRSGLISAMSFERYEAARIIGACGMKNNSVADFAQPTSCTRSDVPEGTVVENAPVVVALKNCFAPGVKDV